MADRLLPNALRDVDGNADERNRTVSIFNGPPPEVLQFDTEQAETTAVAAWIKQALADGVLPAEIGLFVRTRAQLPRARAAVEAAGCRGWSYRNEIKKRRGKVLIGTMHLAKGLEFKAAGVMACDDGVLPLQARMEAVADETDSTTSTIRNANLFYVALTRARDRLLITQSARRRSSSGS